MSDRLNNYIDLLSQMINIPTISDSNNDNKEAFDEFHLLLKKLFPIIFSKFKYEEFNGSILLSYIVSTQKKPILLMSHHDVVSASSNWHYEPFNAKVVDGKIYGRGTLDTKGNLFAILQSIEELLEEGFDFNRSIYIESSCNEETTSIGAYEISRELIKRGVRFEFSLDEGGMIVESPIPGASGHFAMVALGEKDCIDLKFSAKSSGGHSSTPDSNTPLVRLAKFICDVEKSHLFKPRIEDITLETFRRLSSKMQGMTAFIFKHSSQFKHILAKILRKKSSTTKALVQTTICFTKALGSKEFNVIPELAYVSGNIRASHFDKKDDILFKLDKIAKKYDIEIEEIDPGYYSNTCDFKSSQFQFLESMIKEIFPQIVVCPYISVGASDSKYFNDLCDNVFRFAPFMVSNEQLDSMHSTDENIDVSSLLFAVDFYKNLIKKV